MSVYYAILHGSNKDPHLPIAYRTSKRRLIKHLSERYGAETFVIEEEADLGLKYSKIVDTFGGIELCHTMIIEADKAIEHDLFERYQQYNSMHRNHSPLYVSIVEASEGDEIGDVIASVHPF